MSAWSDLPTKVAGEITHVGILAGFLGKECVLWSLLRMTEESLTAIAGISLSVNNYLKVK